jgi:hypothetical protein
VSRRVRAIPQGVQVAAGRATRSSAVEIDTYFDKVSKYIPAEVFALGGPFQHVPGQQVYGSLLLILYTLIGALSNPKKG